MDNDYLDKAAIEALTPPSDYFGAITDLVREGWGQTFGVHRDSDMIDESNWDAIIAILDEKYEKHEDWRIEGSTHWAVGWYDTLMVRVLRCMCTEEDDDSMPDIIRDADDDTWYCQTCGNDTHYTPIFKECLEIRARLEEYPLLDEEDLSRREWEDLSEYVESEVNSIWSRHHDDDIPEHLVDSVLQSISSTCCRSDDVHYEVLEQTVYDEWIKGLIEDATAIHPDQLRLEG
jgi:hypothetical protein